MLIMFGLTLLPAGTLLLYRSSIDEFDSSGGSFPDHLIEVSIFLIVINKTHVFYLLCVLSVFNSLLKRPAMISNPRLSACQSLYDFPRSHVSMLTL